MKSILYVGATLMIGAGIYGFADYKQTSRKKEFRNMYAEKKVTEPEVIANNIKAEPLVEKKEIAATETNADTKKAGLKNTSTATKKTVKKIKKRKTINTRMFSRGAMDERYLKPVKEEEIKLTLDKTEKKDQ